MEYFDSKAAVDAMAALQARIHELEKSNSLLRKETSRLRKIADQDELSMNEKEMALLSASDKAQKMLEGASETLVELRRIKKENRTLKKTLDELHQEYEQRVSKDQKDEECIQTLEKKRTHAKKLIAEYESLFKEILTPPQIDISQTGSIPFNNTTISPTTHSLPATLQTTIQELQTLPFPFRDQKLEKKKEIMDFLMKARDIATRIAEEIHDLELQKSEKGYIRRIQPEIDVKKAHYLLLTQAMARFKFD